MPVIGFLNGGPAGGFAICRSVPRRADATGYIEGQNVTIEYRKAKGIRSIARIRRRIATAKWT